MSREEHARDGVQAVIPNDSIMDVALVMLRGSTFASALGAAAGGGASNSVGWGISSGMITQRLRAAANGEYPSFVLGLSATRLYVLGRDKAGLVGGWKDLELIAAIDRGHLAVSREHRGTIVAIELTDTTTGSKLEFEQKLVGNLGASDLLAALHE